MKNNFSQKKIALIILGSFLSIFILPTQSLAETTANVRLNWETPNSGSSPFKMSAKNIKDTLKDPGLYVSLVGCTGITNKIAGAVQKLVSNAAEEVINSVVDVVCESAQVSIASGESAIPLAGPGLATAITELDLCRENTKDNKNKKATEKQTETIKTQNNVENCLNAIAVGLARKQLVYFTKNAMNWVNSGFGGDPMYVRNVNSFMNSIENRILEKEIDLFKEASPYYYPYGREYARSQVSSWKYNNNIVDSMKQTLTNYLSNGGLGSDAADLVIGNTTNNNYYMAEYANDFSMGGWEGWLAFTQLEQNNPIGFDIINIDRLEEEKERAVEEQKEELAQNDGMLSQKECSEYKTTMKYDEETNSMYEVPGTEAKDCISWETVTPGSLIKDKISYYINSPERQTEMVNSINDLLYTLFAKIISKFEQQGLANINPKSETDYYSSFGGLGSNDSYDVYGNVMDSVVSGFYNESEEKPFNITRDLGNTYITETPSKLGNWNASINLTDANKNLLVGIGIKNTYYVVSTPGKTNLFEEVLEGWTGWKDGDIAYFDGNNWRQFSGVGWPANRPPIIDKRGIIQIQQDYINSSQNLLKTLKKVMPTYGELDYCIPGPNPNWKDNSAETYGFFVEFVSGFRTDFSKGRFLERNEVTIMPPLPGNSIYENYKSAFYNTNGSFLSEFWKNILGENEAWSGTTLLASFLDYISGNKYPSTNDMLPWEGKKQMSYAQDRIDQLLEESTTDVDNFYKDYEAYFKKTYGDQSSMLNLTVALNKNRGDENKAYEEYLEMGMVGVNEVKNIVNYGFEVEELKAEYNDSITQACTNIYSLNKIRVEVEKIVKAAQERRDKEVGKINDVCKEFELGTYIYNDKIKTSGCFNSDIDNTLEKDTYDSRNRSSGAGASLRATDMDRSNCNNGADDDNDGDIDTDDSECHTDGDANNTESYDLNLIEKSAT